MTSSGASEMAVYYASDAARRDALSSVHSLKVSLRRVQISCRCMRCGEQDQCQSRDDEGVDALKLAAREGKLTFTVQSRHRTDEILFRSIVTR